MNVPAPPVVPTDDPPLFSLPPANSATTLTATSYAASSHVRRVPSIVLHQPDAPPEKIDSPISSPTTVTHSAEKQPPDPSATAARHAPGTIYFSDPEWRRRNAWNWPWDIYLLTNYLVTALLTATFPIAALILPDPMAAYLVQVLAFEIPMIIATLLGIFIGAYETESRKVRDAQLHRSSTYVMHRGERAIDRKTGICRVCRVKPEEGTWHCKRCNKCVQNHDHHCRWLNCCIARGNRTAFNFMLVCMVLAGGVYFAVIIRVIIHLFQGNLNSSPEQILAITSRLPGIVPNYGTLQALRVTVILLLLIATICFLGVLQLAFLHTRLFWIGKTTTEYLRDKRHARRAARRQAAKASLESGLSGQDTDSVPSKQPNAGRDVAAAVSQPLTATPANGKVTRGARPGVYVDQVQDRQVGQVLVAGGNSAGNSGESAEDESDVLWGSRSSGG